MRPKRPKLGSSRSWTILKSTRRFVLCIELHPDVPITRNAPFTIQRICELCIRPQEHYKAVGKYLRAVEKALLVTSTWDSFPNPVCSEARPNGNGPTTSPLSIGPISVPTTPTFSRLSPSSIATPGLGPNLRAHRGRHQTNQTTQNRPSVALMNLMTHVRVT
jgi:hypothetical protein